MRRFHRDLEPAHLFWATEAGKCTGRTHIHGLIGGSKHRFLPAVTPEQVFNYGSEKFGRTKAAPFDPAKGGSRYVSKYVTKGHYDYEVY